MYARIVRTDQILFATACRLPFALSRNLQADTGKLLQPDGTLPGYRYEQKPSWASRILETLKAGRMPIFCFR